MSVPQARDAKKRASANKKKRRGGDDDDDGWSRTSLSGGGGSKTGRGGKKSKKSGRSGGGGGGGGGDKRGRAVSDSSTDASSTDGSDGSNDDDDDDDERPKKPSRDERAQLKKKRKKKRKKEKQAEEIRRLERELEKATAQARGGDTESDSSVDYGSGVPDSDDGKRKKKAKKGTRKKTDDPEVPSDFAQAIINLKQVLSAMGQCVGAGWPFRNGLTERDDLCEARARARARQRLPQEAARMLVRETVLNVIVAHVGSLSDEVSDRTKETIGRRKTIASAPRPSFDARARARASNTPANAECRCVRRHDGPAASTGVGADEEVGRGDASRQARGERRVCPPTRLCSPMETCVFKQYCLFYNGLARPATFVFLFCNGNYCFETTLVCSTTVFWRSARACLIPNP